MAVAASKTSDVIVIGGGAAGLICAGTAALRGKRVIVLERMERPARKVGITGKGRCNLTNDCDEDAFRASVKTNARFLYSAYSAFSARDTMGLFEGLGVPLKTERGNRVFPASDRAVDIVDGLVRYAAGNGARIIRERAAELILEDGAVTGVICESGARYNAGSAVIATGGLSYPKTGSTGDGYNLAAQAGHTIIPVRASLVPIVTREGWCGDVMGLSLKNVSLALIKDGASKPAYREQGEMLFTHFGVSGPLVLSASAHIDGDPAAYRLSVNLKPALEPRQLDARLLRDFSENQNRDFANSLGALLPRKLIPVIIGLSGIERERKVNQITKEERRRLAALLQDIPLRVAGLRPVDEAVVTGGGVRVTEVSPSSMQSKITSGLFFAGEVLDVDAYTGGFNLQIAFSTGYLAGSRV